MKIQMEQSVWLNNKMLEVGEVIEADGKTADFLLRFGHEIKDREDVPKIQEYETKVILPKTKGKKK